MNWIATNIRFPEDLYMRLKIEAARRRKSVASIVRERLTNKLEINTAGGQTLLEDLERFARKNAKVLKGVNLTKALIKMRYEQ